MAKEDKLKALDAAIAQIEKQYGKGSVMKLGDNSANMNVEVVDLGVPVLSMHAPFELISKVDVYEAYRAFHAFFTT